MLLNKKSFTLIELIIVVVIIGILASMGLPGFNKTKERALDREARANLELIIAAEKIYRMENGRYWPIPPSAVIAGNSTANINSINTELRVSLPATTSTSPSMLGTISPWTYTIDNSGGVIPNFYADRTGTPGENRQWSAQLFSDGTITFLCTGSICY